MFGLGTHRGNELMKVLPLTILIASIGLLGGCVATKVVTVPAKVAYNTAKVAGKGVYLAGKGAYFLGKGVYRTGQGAYYIGMTPVRVFDGALERADRVVRFTGNVIDTAGKVQEFSKIVTIDALEDELSALKKVGEVTNAALKRASDKDARRAKELGLIDKVDGTQVEPVLTPAE